MIGNGEVLQKRYRIEKQIGQGGMGSVYVATDERFGSVVAIKQTLFTDEKFRKAFEREARLLNSLRHPALPRVSDHFIEGFGQFLVMEYIEGDDLSEQLDYEGRTFDVKEVLNWADQLLDALEYLHAQEMPVIHRDIKPQNLKLTSRGQIILLDFGLAKGNATNPESATAAKSLIGYSRNYASLEQIQGTGTDPRSDLYSLSATLYHLLSGVPPADALTRAMNVLNRKEDPLVKAHEIRAEIPLEVSEILYQAMSLNPDERPNSAQELREMLRDNENFVIPERAETGSVKMAGTNIFTQKTQIHADSVNQPEIKQSQIKTEGFPEAISKETKVNQIVTGDLEEQKTKIHPLAGTSGHQKPRRGLAVGAALGVLISALCAAAAIYVFKPSAFGIDNSANTNSGKKVILVNVPAENANVIETNTNAANTNSVIVSSDSNTGSETKQKEVVTKQPETKQTETSKSSTKPKSEVNIVTSKNNSETDDEDDVPDVDETSTPPKNPKTGKQIPTFVWKKMSPEERRQLREALEIQKKQEQLERQRKKQPRPPKPPPDDN